MIILRNVAVIFHVFLKGKIAVKLIDGVSMKNLLKLSLLLSVLIVGGAYSFTTPDEIVVYHTDGPAITKPITINGKELKFGRSIVLPASENGSTPFQFEGKTYTITYHMPGRPIMVQEAGQADRFQYKTSDIISGKKNASGMTKVFNVERATWAPANVDEVNNETK